MTSFTELPQINTLQQEAIVQITKLIIEGELQPGQRVNEVELSKRLNMSRGPIRESLRILNQEGLLTYLPRRGMFVTELGPSDIHEIYDIRFYLERSAVELGSHCASDELLDDMQQLVEEMAVEAGKGRKDRIVKLDAKFHECIMACAGYPRLLNSWRAYNGLVELIFAQVFDFGTEKLDEIPISHQELVDIARLRNPGLLVEALSQHYMGGKEKLLKVWGNCFE